MSLSPVGYSGVDDSRAAGPLLVLHAGGLGDLVLASALVAGLRSGPRPRRVVLACREEVAPVVDLYPVPPDAVVGIPFNPYLAAEPGAELVESLAALGSRLEGVGPSLVVDASVRPTWLGALLAARLGTELLVSSPRAEGGALASLLLGKLGLEAGPVRSLETPPGASESRRYGLLLEALAAPGAASFPWALPAAARERAAERLSSLGLVEGRFVACVPGGVASTAVKQWPEERFASVLRRLRESRGLESLLVGDASERDLLDRLAARISSEGGSVRVFCGAPGELPVLAGLLASARAAVGNDTGPAHLAAAFGTPTVTVFGGGGEWPAYAPWAPGAVGVVRPLPCFGCGWDCFLGHALCVESIPVEEVVRALDDVLDAPSAPPAVRSLPAPGGEIDNLVRAASGRYREAQRDRVRRQEVILALQGSLERLRPAAARAGELEREVEELRRTAWERLATLERVHAEAGRMREAMVELTDAVGARDAKIAVLESRLVEAERVLASEGDEEAEQAEQAEQSDQAEQPEGAGKTGGPEEA